MHTVEIQKVLDGIYIKWKLSHILAIRLGSGDMKKTYKGRAESIRGLFIALSYSAAWIDPSSHIMIFKCF